jgi:hypothetical protein
MDNGLPKKDPAKAGDQFRGPGSARFGGGSGTGGY